MLTDRLGAKSRPSSQQANHNETKLVTPPDFEKANHTDIDRLVHIEDSYTTNMAISPTKYHDEYRGLLAFPDGATIVVNYLHQQYTEQGIKTFVPDFSNKEDDVHKSLVEIKNFELKLVDSLSPDLDNEDNSFEISGEAITYPGFTPFIGDMFFLKLGDDIALFRVNEATPTSYRTGRYHRISFSFKEYVTAKLYQDLYNSVSESYIFDKDRYLETGKLSYFTEKDYITLGRLKEYRKEIIQEYMDSFYSDSIYSVIRPDNLYDPYLVEFLNTKLTSSDYNKRARQLMTRLDNYKESIWYHISKVHDKSHLKNIAKYIVIKRHKSLTTMTDHNGLLNREYIYLTQHRSDVFKPKKKPIKYHENHPNEYYYDNLGNYRIPKPHLDCHHHEHPPYYHYPHTHKCDKELMSSLYFLSEEFFDKKVPLKIHEQVLLDYLTLNRVNDKYLLELLENYRDMQVMDKFYFIPILIELVDFRIRTIGK